MPVALVPRTNVFNMSRVLLLSPDCMVFDEEEPFPLPLGGGNHNELSIGIA